MDREQFIQMMCEAKLYDLTQGCSIFTPPWPGEKSLEVHFFKRLTGAYGFQAKYLSLRFNPQHLNNPSSSVFGGMYGSRTIYQNDVRGQAL